MDSSLPYPVNSKDIYLLPKFLLASKEDQIPMNNSAKSWMWKPRDVEIDDDDCENASGNLLLNQFKLLLLLLWWGVEGLFFVVVVVPAPLFHWRKFTD